MDSFVISCEHGGNRIPAAYRSLFRGHRALLDSHRGYDAGALVMARALARSFTAPLVASTTSRLLVDLNRSIGHRQLFFDAVRGAPVDLRKAIIAKHYRPYRLQVGRLVERAVLRGRRVIHVSTHSFTPQMNGAPRHADVGLLYDPRRPGEVALCRLWKAALAASAPGLIVRRNYPYAGRNDGLTSQLRRRFPPEVYVGIELEVNQKIVHGTGRGWSELRGVLAGSLRSACSQRPQMPAPPRPCPAVSGDP